MGYVQIGGFRPISGYISETVQDSDIVLVYGKPSLKGAWSGHANHLNFDGKGWSYSGQILIAGRLCQVPAWESKITLKRGVVRVTCPTWETDRQNNVLGLSVTDTRHAVTACMYRASGPLLAYMRCENSRPMRRAVINLKAKLCTGLLQRKCLTEVSF